LTVNTDWTIPETPCRPGLLRIRHLAARVLARGIGLESNARISEQKIERPE